MKEIYSIASAYYSTFYKLHKHITLSISSIFFVIGILLTLSLISISFLSIFGITPYNGNANTLFGLALFFEFLTLIAAFSTQRNITNKIKEKCTYLSKEQGLSLSDYKKLWLINEFNLPESELTSAAIKINNITKICNEQRSEDYLSTRTIAMYIFNSEAKNRTLSLLLGLISLVTVLFIKSESVKYKIDMLFELFQPSVLWIIFALCTGIMFLSWVINGIIKNTMPHIFKKREIEVKVLIRDMIELSKTSIRDL